MATTVQKRGKRHTATVRYRSISLSSTFSTRLMAEQWAFRVHQAIDNCIAAGTDFDPSPFKVAKRTKEQFPLKGVTPERAQQVIHQQTILVDDNKPTAFWTFKRVAEDYLQTVTMKKKSFKDERNRIRVLQDTTLGKMAIGTIAPQDVYDYLYGLRHHKTGKPLAAVSIRNTAFLISSIYEKARASTFQGGYNITDLDNPVRHVTLPSPPKATRQRAIEPNLMKEFFIELNKNPSPFTDQLRTFFTLALLTGMRRSEIIALHWHHVTNSANGMEIHLEDSKSGHPRTVFLNASCGSALKNIMPNKADQQARIFQFSKELASKRFHHIMTKLGYPKTRLHDLRHTALSNMANSGFTLKELMSQSGHRTATVASRYLHVDEKTIRTKLSQIKV